MFTINICLLYNKRNLWKIRRLYEKNNFIYIVNNSNYIIDQFIVYNVYTLFVKFYVYKKLDIVIVIYCTINSSLFYYRNKLWKVMGYVWKNNK